jgi:hypothetical protein
LYVCHKQTCTLYTLSLGPSGIHHTLFSPEQSNEYRLVMTSVNSSFRSCRHHMLPAAHCQLATQASKPRGNSPADWRLSGQLTMTRNLLGRKVDISSFVPGHPANTQHYYARAHSTPGARTACHGYPGPCADDHHPGTSGRQLCVRAAPGPAYFRGHARQLEEGT